MIQDVRSYLLNLQKNLCEHIVSLEVVAKFNIEDWQHETGGGGRTAVLEGGETIERAGVNFSHVLGQTLPPAATTLRPELAGSAFEALGVSTVIHPRNPFVPTAHMNVRFFSSRTKDGNPIWWFGGGFDLTPYYPFEEDCIHWHEIAAKACEPFGMDVYKRFKKNCDEYFYIKHRKEARGIGGLFFDDLNDWSFEKCFEFMQSIGNHFVLAYMPILQKRKDIVYGEREKQFQCYRRGRYVEFNLVYDRGTLFGLQSGGRTESILMSLPPEVRFQYAFEPANNSPEARLKAFLKPREWLQEELLVE